MAIDFPNSPALNAYFESNGKAWTFNGTSWDIVQTPANLSIANGSITGAKLASGAAVTNIGYTPANTASPTFTGTVVLPSDTSIGTITSTELGYVDGVTSAIQTQLNAKAPLSAPTFTGTVTLPSTTSIGTVSATEIGYVDGVTSAIQTQLDSKLTTTTAVTSNRNALINGALEIWQRGTSFTSSGVYSADRFIVGRSGGASGATFTRVSPNDSTNLPFFRYAMRCQRNSGNTGTAGLTVGQVIETANSIPLAGKTVTLSFYARRGADFTGTNLYSYVYTGTGTDQNGILGAWTGSALPVTGTHALTTTWARYSATGTLSSTTNEIFFNFASSPTGTAGANDWYEVTGIQLEIGAVATPFEFEDIGITLQKCQRYYERIGTSGTTGGLSVCYKIYGNHYFPIITYAVTKRGSPIAYFTSDTGASPRDGKVRLYGDNVAYSVSGQVYTTHIKWYVSGVANTNGLADWDYIEIEAEL